MPDNNNNDDNNNNNNKSCKFKSNLIKGECGHEVMRSSTDVCGVQVMWDFKPPRKPDNSKALRVSDQGLGSPVSDQVKLSGFTPVCVVIVTVHLLLSGQQNCAN